MTDRETEHYDIACRLGNRAFTRSEFKNLYRQVYPERKLGSMLPADYCVIGPGHPRHAKGTEDYPKVLRWIGRGCYQLIEDASFA
jgi:hypothetical protein